MKPSNRGFGKWWIEHLPHLDKYDLGLKKWEVAVMREVAEDSWQAAQRAAYERAATLVEDLYESGPLFRNVATLTLIAEAIRRLAEKEGE